MSKRRAWRLAWESACYSRAGTAKLHRVFFSYKYLLAARSRLILTTRTRCRGSRPAIEANGQLLDRSRCSPMISDKRLVSDRFPRSSKYHPEWVIASLSSGANALWLTEWLADALDLRPGMRVLDLGSGRAMSSISLRRRF